MHDCTHEQTEKLDSFSSVVKQTIQHEILLKFVFFMSPFLFLLISIPDTHTEAKMSNPEFKFCRLASRSVNLSVKPVHSASIAQFSAN